MGGRTQEVEGAREKGRRRGKVEGDKEEGWGQGKVEGARGAQRCNDGYK